MTDAESGAQDQSVISYPLDAETLDAPHWEAHWRGKNWLARLHGPNAARMERLFCVKKTVDGRPVYLTDDIGAGDALELGADYITTGHNRHRWRRYYVVVEKNDDAIILHKYPSAATAIKAARNGEKAVA